jgi:hypothetical protein
MDIKAEVRKRLDNLNEAKEKRYAISYVNSYGFTYYITKKSAKTTKVSDIKLARKFTKSEVDDFFNDPLAGNDTEYKVVEL